MIVPKAQIAQRQDPTNAEINAGNAAIARFQNKSWLFVKLSLSYLLYIIIFNLLPKNINKFIIMKLFDYALFGNVILNYLITFFLYKHNIIRYGIKYIIRI